MIPHSALRQRLNVNQTQRVKILTAGSSVLQLAPVAKHAKFVTSSRQGLIFYLVCKDYLLRLTM